MWKNIIWQFLVVYFLSSFRLSFLFIRSFLPYQHCNSIPVWSLLTCGVIFFVQSFPQPPSTQNHMHLRVYKWHEMREHVIVGFQLNSVKIFWTKFFSRSHVTYGNRVEIYTKKKAHTFLCFTCRLMLLCIKMNIPYTVSIPMSMGGKQMHAIFLKSILVGCINQCLWR